jgi:hypothetical protein
LDKKRGQISQRNEAYNDEQNEELPSLFTLDNNFALVYDPTSFDERVQPTSG